ncbi:spore coat protein SP85-like [Coccinella septempunctata]|uniref:spore coat protein SP85-like n=1 Tax=Coccinella septempunctata TaxID=41139 RepID=UPI001D0622FA|nr:spore coat protein SP85-like [Coccinella septempunctata]
MGKSKCIHFLLILLVLLENHLVLCKKSISSGRISRPSRPRPNPTHRPYTAAPTHRPYTAATRAPTYKPFPSPVPTYRPQSVPGRNPTYRPATQPGRYPTQSSRYPQGPPPAYPGNQPGAYRPTFAQPNQQSFQRPLQIPQPGGTTKVKVYNINNYHPPNYYAPMVYPSYHYSPVSTGSGVLGFFLGYSLARITSPTFSHCHSCYNGYVPRYDHYTVHHYYHNNNNVPKEQTVTTNNIITCGDSSQICPANTISLCTATGQIMCVVAVTKTIPCDKDPNMKCVQSSVPCENNDAPECKGKAKGETTTVNIPCISNTIIEGNVTTVNNTIVSADPPKNTTEITTTISTTTSSSDSTTTEQTTISNTFPSLGANNTFPSLGTSRAKREAAQPFCVTILAEPSVRKSTEGEIAFNEVTNVFEKFFSNAFKTGDKKK